MITAENVQFSYGDKFALTNISFQLKKGVVGLLGENGAGKTTLLKILSTLLPLQSGCVYINDIPLNAANAMKVRSTIGFMPQDFDFYPSFTVYEILEYLSILNKMSKNDYNDRITFLLETLNLTDQMHIKSKALSGGMKRRLGLACAIIKEPEILIVDEPTVGLDPNERINMRNFLRKYAENRLVLLSTHLVEDIQSLCTDVVILSKGQLLFNMSVKDILEQSPPTYQLTCQETQIETYKASGSVTNLSIIDNQCILRITSSNTIFSEYTRVESSLEDAYMFMLYEHSKQ